MKLKDIFDIKDSDVSFDKKDNKFSIRGKEDILVGAGTSYTIHTGLFIKNKDDSFKIYNPADFEGISFFLNMNLNEGSEVIITVYNNTKKNITLEQEDCLAKIVLPDANDSLDNLDLKDLNMYQENIDDNDLYIFTNMKSIAVCKTGDGQIVISKPINLNDVDVQIDGLESN